jgi:hypothetical protein
MKTKILMLVYIITTISCSKDVSTYVNVKGRVEREFNGEGIANQMVYIETIESSGSGLTSYSRIIDTKWVTTDSKGNFSTTMKNDNSTLLYAFKPKDDNYTSSERGGFNLNYILLKVNKYTKYKVYVKNINPFDLNDYVHIDFFSGNYQSFMEKIENFGIQNIYIPSEGSPGQGITGGAEDSGWKGINVNSIVYYNVPENSDLHRINWSVWKNGIQTTGLTNEIPFEIDQSNEYHFDY